MLRSLCLLAAIICVANATFLIRRPKPKPQPQPTCSSKCNVFKEELNWVLDDCWCRPMQNICLRDEENAERLRSKRTPLVPVSEDVCRHFIPKLCLLGKPVIATFAKPPGCGCPNKPGTLEEIRFPNWLKLLQFAAEQKKPFVSYRNC